MAKVGRPSARMEIVMDRADRIKMMISFIEAKVDRDLEFAAYLDNQAAEAALTQRIDTLARLYALQQGDEFQTTDEAIKEHMEREANRYGGSRS